MYAILLGGAAAFVYYNANGTTHHQARTATQQERATREYGINVTLDQNNDYLFWGQKHMARLDERVRPYKSYGDGIEQYNKRFENKSRLINHLFKVRNPVMINPPSSNDHFVRLNLITPWVLDEKYQASPPRPLRVQTSNTWQ